MNAVSLAIGVSLSLMDNLQQTQGVTGGNSDPVQSTLTDLRQNTNQLSDSTSTKNDATCTGLLL